MDPSLAPPLTHRLQWLAPTLKDIFGEVDKDFLALMAPRMQTLELPGGSVLLRQGDAPDAIYFVLSGRLRASTETPDGNTLLLGEIGRGEPIGEMGVVTGAPRLARVTALRDCVLLKLGVADFNELMAGSPGVALQLARKMVQRLTENQRIGTVHKRIVNVCLLPLSQALDLGALARQLHRTLAQQLDRSLPPDDAAGHAIALIDRARVEDALGAGLADTLPEQSDQHHRLLRWLDAEESAHAMQVFCADPTDTPWTRLCLRHADHILLVADADDDPAPRAVESALLMGEHPQAAVTQSLWLLHPDDRPVPHGTARWLDARPHIRMDGLSHFHTRHRHAGDWGRLARILSGQATGLVLAGGGARGLAQFGIMQALMEKGVDWDMAAGTSMGSVTAALAAMDLPIAHILRVARKAFSRNPTSDVNWLPVASVIRGRRLAQVVRDGMREAVGADVQIEDLWKPFFCVASNYSREQIEVLRRGPLDQAIMASAAIPAALPPVLHHGDILIDGGTFNNYPVDIMRASGAARVIGVDQGRGRRYRPLTLERMPTPWQLFVDRFLRPRRKRRYKGIPGLATIVFNASAMASTTHEKRMRDAADLAFTPDVAKFGMLQWSAFDLIVAVGLEHGRQRLEASPEVFEHAWHASRHIRR